MYRFGGQIVLADGAVAGLGLLLGGVPLLAFPFAAPAVHLLHDDGMGAAGSLVLHLAGPVAGAYIGYELDVRSCTSDFCGLGGLILGGLAGAITATLVDAAFLAQVERPLPGYTRRPLVVPSLAIARGGGLMLGVAGSL